MTPAPEPRHQEVGANLADALRAHVKARGLGKVLYAPVDCILSDTTIVQPDLLYLDTNRIGTLSARAVEGARRSRWRSSRRRRRTSIAGRSFDSTRDTMCRTTGS